MKTPSSLLIGLALVGVGACGGDDGGGVTVDAPPVATTVTISGIAASISISGRTPEAGVVVTAYKVSDDTMIGTATTDAAGAFSISAMTNGSAVDGYLKATKATFKDTYLYPPGPLSADFAGATVLLLTPANWNAVNTQLLGETQDAGHGWVGMLVVDNITSQMPIMGATVTTTPAGKVHYNSAQGLPQAQATSTAVDGIGYAVNVAAGQVTVSAAKSGATFKSHAVNARADQITLTIVTE
jgi:hypothetical protein